MMENIYKFASLAALDTVRDGMRDSMPWVFYNPDPAIINVYGQEFEIPQYQTISTSLIRFFSGKAASDDIEPYQFFEL